MSVNNRPIQVSTIALIIVWHWPRPPLLRTNMGGQSSANSRSVANGQKMTIKGVVTHRDIDANTFVVQDVNGVNTTVRLTDTTSVKSKGGFFGGGSTYGATNILRGLNSKSKGAAMRRAISWRRKCVSAAPI
jgi:hypothetical protein